MKRTQMRLGGAQWGNCEHSVNLIFAACLSVGGMKGDEAAAINNKHDNKLHKRTTRRRANVDQQTHVEKLCLELAGRSEEDRVL